MKPLLVVLLLSSCAAPHIQSKSEWVRECQTKWGDPSKLTVEPPSRYAWTTAQCYSAWRTRVLTGSFAAGFAAFGSGAALGSALEGDKTGQIALGATAAGTTVLAAAFFFANKSLTESYTANCVQEPH